jgi:hypothetical protein
MGCEIPDDSSRVWSDAVMPVSRLNADGWLNAQRVTAVIASLCDLYNQIRLESGSER